MIRRNAISRRRRKLEKNRGLAPHTVKSSEIASRVIIAGYRTELNVDELNQRVSATLKKYLNKDFDWDSQRYRLANRN